MNLPGPIITLTTDFGGDDGYVGAVKGVILSICSPANIIDCAHQIDPQNIVQAAMALEAAALYYPPATIHLAVVDPGVGTNRRRLAALTERQIFVGPDNGVFGLVFRRESPQRIFSIENEKYLLTGRSTTFDGRDIFAPAAAHLANGLDPAELGPQIDNPVALPWPENTLDDQEITGAIVATDRFGNLITSIHRDEIDDNVPAFTVHVGNRKIPGPAVSYAEGPSAAGGYRALFGSAGYLEIALPGDSAATHILAGWGDVVSVVW